MSAINIPFTDTSTWWHGDRFITALGYISSPQVSAKNNFVGQTIFPHLKLSVPPERGSLLLWPNLSTDGQPLPDMEHASCPLLYGHKFIVNKWLRWYPQMFSFPCPAQI